MREECVRGEINARLSHNGDILGRGNADPCSMRSLFSRLAAFGRPSSILPLAGSVKF